MFVPVFLTWKFQATVNIYRSSSVFDCTFYIPFYSFPLTYSSFLLYFVDESVSKQFFSLYEYFCMNSLGFSYFKSKLPPWNWLMLLEILTWRRDAERRKKNQFSYVYPPIWGWSNNDQEFAINQNPLMRNYYIPKCKRTYLITQIILRNERHKNKNHAPIQAL